MFCLERGKGANGYISLDVLATARNGVAHDEEGAAWMRPVLNEKYPEGQPKQVEGNARSFGYDDVTRKRS